MLQKCLQPLSVHKVGLINGVLVEYKIDKLFCVYLRSQLVDAENGQLKYIVTYYKLVKLSVINVVVPIENNLIQVYLGVQTGHFTE